MVQVLESLVTALESNPLCPVRELRVLPSVEREQVLYGWNATEVAYPQDRCLHELFEEQVSRTQDAPAVIVEEETLNYKN